MEFNFPAFDEEVQIVMRESGIGKDRAALLVRLAGKLRALKGQDLEEGISTRLIVYAATMIEKGMPVERAVQSA